MDDPRFSTRLAKLASSNRHDDDDAAGDADVSQTVMGARKTTRRGVLYFSSIPTNMRPNEVRTHFAKFGPLLRQKFVPFPKKVISNGKSLAPLQFKEGYLEFQMYEDAKKAADIMNMSFIGCKRFRKAYGQKWNVRLLEHFSWDTIVEMREEELRHRKYKEYKAKELERATNDHFRQMLSLKRGRCTETTDNDIMDGLIRGTVIKDNCQLNDKHKKTVKEPMNTNEHTDHVTPRRKLRRKV